jgi:hypothetical protein
MTGSRSLDCSGDGVIGRRGRENVGWSDESSQRF